MFSLDVNSNDVNIVNLRGYGHNVLNKLTLRKIMKRHVEGLTRRFFIPKIWIFD